MAFYSGYLAKMCGDRPCPPRAGWSEMAWSWLGAFVGMLLVAGLDRLLFRGTDGVLMIASFGASAVLLYGAPTSPLAQPRNLLGGHLLSAFIGVACYRLLPQLDWVAAALAVSVSILVMHLTRTLHPPAGATALIAVIGSPKIHSLGFIYPLLPVFTGAVLLLAVAVLINNLVPNRRYPLWWF
ncbi:MAG: HPP family protein [Magnetococcus sp. YQC-5]